MTYEFTGKTEQEAIKKAMRELSLKEGEFDVEIVEKFSEGFLFKREQVRVKIYPQNSLDLSFSEDIFDMVLEFIKGVIFRMGYDCELKLEKRDSNILKINLETNNPNILIGREGKNLDALQLLANIYLIKLLGDDFKSKKIIIDIEDYRQRHKSKFVNLAIDSLHRVRRTRKPLLLEPMSPFERRIIHTTLSRYNDVNTESEGEGNLKRVKIYCLKKGNNSHYKRERNI